MPLDGLSIHALREEMMERLRNGRVFRIFQPWPDTLIFHLRVGGVVERLLLSASPQVPAAHITTLQPENPVQAPVFAMVCRKYLEPARLLRIDQVGLDRILHFVFETFDEQGQRVERTLVAELTGRQSNVVLIDPAENRVIDALRRTGSGGRGRHLMPGALYEPPFADAKSKVNPLAESREEFHRSIRLAPAPKSMHCLLMERYDGFGPFAAKEVVRCAGLPETSSRGELDSNDLEDLAETFFDFVSRINAHQYEPTLFYVNSEPDFWLFRPTASDISIVKTVTSMQEVADKSFAEQNNALRLGKLQGELLRPLRRAHARAQRKLAERLKEEDASTQAELYKHQGDLLTAYIHQIEPHSNAVTVADYMDNYKDRTIPLDPLLSPVDNVQAYYRKYQRAKRAATELKRLVRQARREVSYLAQVIAFIELAEDEQDLAEIRQELIQEGLLPNPRDTKRTRRVGGRSQPLRFTSSDGLPIWVGRNNRQNDQLTMRTARPDDLWFHTKDIPGSHVIMRVSGEPSENALEEAATIAAYYSKARDSANVAVDFVARKHVRKPSGAPPGYVVYDHHKTLYVTPDVQVIRRLQENESRPDG